MATHSSWKMKPAMLTLMLLGATSAASTTNIDTDANVSTITRSGEKLHKHKRLLQEADQQHHRETKSGKAGAFIVSKAGKSKSGTPLSGKSGKATTAANTNMASKLASDLRVMVKMEKNFDNDADCSMAEWNLCYTRTLMLDYSGDVDYTNNQFQIYFSSIHRLLQVNHPDFKHQHVIGDLTYIEPTSSFKGFGASSTVEIPVVHEFWSVQETDNMPRWFVMDKRDGSTAVIENTNAEDVRDFVMPYTSTLKTPTDANIPMTANSRYDLNDETVSPGIDANDRIIPTPLRTEIADDAQTFGISGVKIKDAALLGDLGFGVADIMNKLDISLSGNHEVQLVLGALPLDIIGSESYMMNITTDGTMITATEKSGLFYGIVSLVGLLDVGGEDMSLKEMVIHDKPRFAYRGHQVDVARNFRSKSTILKTIDAMALWKLNVMHLAMTNDEGWRLQIPGLEELTSVGSKRCFDPSEETCLLTQLGSGPEPSNKAQYYTRQDYIDILKYASKRNVKILPEFNMPAHARAAVMSMEARAKNGDAQYRLMDPQDETYMLTIQFYDKSSIINPCMDSSVRFVRKLVGEVKSMHDDAGIPLHSYHFGGDEAKNILLGNGFSSFPDDMKEMPFSKSPACQRKAQEDSSFDIEHIANYWALKVNDILAEHGVMDMHAWEDGLRGTTKGQYDTESVAVDFWETLYWGGISGLVDIASHGFDIIMANPDYLYFDFPYEVNPEERGYYWAARFNSVYKVFTFAPENLAQNAETSTDRDGNDMSVTTPDVPMPTIRGMQGQTWSETIRTDEQYFEMAFPRVLAVAERAWHRATWERDWSPGVTYDATTGLVSKDDLLADYDGFVTALGCKETLKLEKLGITYRVPPPGATIDSVGTLSANSELPCTDIMYSTDGGSMWVPYSDPVNVGVGQAVLLKSVSSNGAMASRVVPVE